jgi:hypothetical protein
MPWQTMKKPSWRRIVEAFECEGEAWRLSYPMCAFVHSGDPTVILGAFYAHNY